MAMNSGKGLKGTIRIIKRSCDEMTPLMNAVAKKVAKKKK